MTTPFLLLDIDGVLIPFPNNNGEPPPTHRRHFVTPTGRGAQVPIWLNPTDGPMLRHLFATAPVQPIWASSWQQDANPLIGARLGLPKLDHIPLGRPAITISHPNGYLWKRDPISRWAGGLPIAWIDDDFAELDHQWAAHRKAAGHPTLLVQPDARVGLQPVHVQQIRDWALSVASQARSQRISGMQQPSDVLAERPKSDAA